MIKQQNPWKDFFKEEGVERFSDILTPREQKILEMRLGLVDDKCYTLEKIARKFQVTRERIRQLEARSLERIRLHTLTKLRCDLCMKEYPEEELSRPQSKEYSHILLCQDCLEDIMMGVKKLKTNI